MGAFIKRHTITTSCAAFLVALVTSWTAWTATAASRGHVVARIDVWRGQYVLLLYGEPTPSREEFVQLLHDRYDIKTRTIAGCTVSESLMKYANGYDAVVRSAATRKFGRDVIKECTDEARKDWELRRHSQKLAAEN